MTLDAMIMFAGGAVALIPFLGFPHTWDTVLLFLLGLIVILLGIAVRRHAHEELLRRKNDRAKKEMFVESAPHQTFSEGAEHETA